MRARPCARVTITNHCVSISTWPQDAAYRKQKTRKGFHSVCSELYSFENQQTARLCPGSRAKGVDIVDYDFSNPLGMVQSMTQANNEWSAQQAQKQMDFQRMMSDTAHQRQVADLKAAGLNPVLSAHTQGASTPSGAMGDTDHSGVVAFANMFTDLMSQMISSQTALGLSAIRGGSGSGGNAGSLASLLGDNADSLDSSAKPGSGDSSVELHGYVPTGNKKIDAAQRAFYQLTGLGVLDAFAPGFKSYLRDFERTGQFHNPSAPAELVLRVIHALRTSAKSNPVPSSNRELGSQYIRGTTNSSSSVSGARRNEKK